MMDDDPEMPSGVAASEQRFGGANQTALIERAVLAEAPLSAVGTAGDECSVSARYDECSVSARYKVRARPLAASKGEIDARSTAW